MYIVYPVHRISIAYPLEHWNIMATLGDALKTFCHEQGKSEDDILQLLQAKRVVTPEVKKMVVEHVITDRDHEKGFSSVHRRNLRLFSGTKPAPSGEVNFATRRVQVNTSFMIQGSRTQARNGVTDSLLLPALNLARNAPAGLSVQDLFDKLIKVYGSTKSPDDMTYDFFELYQAEDDKASDYLEKIIF